MHWRLWATALVGFLVLRGLAAAQASADRLRLVPAVGHAGEVKSVAFSPDGHTLASGSADKTIKLWNIASGTEIKTLTGHGSNVLAVAFSPDGRTLASGSSDSTVRLWDVASGKQVKTLAGHTNIVWSVAFSHDGRMLASGSEDQTIKLWDVASGREMRGLMGHTYGIQSVAFSPDGRSLASGSGDRIEFWDVASGKKIRSLATYAAYSVAYSPDGRTMASGGNDKAIKLWNVASGKEIRSLVGHTGPVWSVAFSPDGHILASNSWDKTTKLWDLATGQEIRSLTLQKVSLSNCSVAFSPDGRSVASGSGAAIKICDVGSGEEIGTLAGHTNAVSSVAYSPDRRTLASGSEDKTVKLWDVVSGKGTGTLAGHTGRIYSVAFSCDGRTLASCSGDNTIKLWDVASGKEIKSLRGHSDVVRSVAFSPDGRTLASGSGDNTIKLWDVASGNEINTLTEHTGPVYSVVFSPDGRTLASSSADKTIMLWDVASGTEIKALTGHEGYVLAVAFSPDGRVLASGGFDKTITLWDVAGGKEIKTLAGHTDIVLSVAFSPDGRTLASGSGDNTIKLWDVAKGKEIETLAGHTFSVVSVAFSPDGRTLATGSADSTVKFWDPASATLKYTIVPFDDGSWIVADPQARFDAPDLLHVGWIHWVSEDDPYRPLPIEQFMRGYYAPGLWARLMKGEKLPDVPDLTTLNRAVPAVTIMSAKETDDGKSLQIGLRVEPAKVDTYFNVQRQHACLPRDLRLLRDGQLVITESGELDPDGKTYELHKGTYNYTIPLGGGEKVNLLAYAFNDDNVKSANAETEVKLDRPVAASARTAYVIGFGFDNYAGQKGVQNLQCAGNDAEFACSAAGSRLKGFYVVRRVYKDRSRNEVHAILTELAGRVKPDDLVLIFWSGHGDTDAKGVFDLVPSSGAFISSSEIADWLRPIDTREMGLVLDTCRSAESTGPDFKPGPFGDAGLGQLAYDKGMAILCASRGPAIETGNLKDSEGKGHGLLTYALVEKGLVERKDVTPMSISDWFTLGEKLVPQAVGKARDVEVVGPVDSSVQQPARFDFSKFKEPVISGR